MLIYSYEDLWIANFNIKDKKLFMVSIFYKEK